MSCWWKNYMLKLCLYVYLAFSLKIDEVWCCCWWIDVEIMLTVPVVAVMCYYWWLEPWVFIIIEIVVRISLFLRFLQNGSNGDFCSKGVFTQILYGFEPLLMSENVWFNFRNKFGLGGFKIGVLGWKMRFYDSKLSWLARRVSLLATASKGVTESMLCSPRRAGPLAIASNVVTERVLCSPQRANSLGRRVASVPVFLFCFLCPFYTFLCRIGFWYKHGSSR